MYHQQTPTDVMQFRMLRHFDPRLDAKSGSLKERVGRDIVFPQICSETGKTTGLRLLEGPRYEVLSKSTAAIGCTDSDAVYQEAFPVLGLVDWLQNLHSIRRKDGAVFFPQPCGWESVDHAHYPLIVRYQAMAPAAATAIQFHASGH